MMRGIDITTFDLLPLDLARRNQGGFRRHVIDFTCDLKHKWTDEEKNTYDLPDQVWHIQKGAGSLYDSNTVILKTDKDVKNSLASSVGLGVNFNLGMFTASPSYQQTQQTLAQTPYYIEEVSAHVGGMEVDLESNLAMTGGRNFKHVVEILPNYFNSASSAQYFNLIKYFGTHYFTSANFGGMVKLHIETNSNYFQRHSISQIQQQARAAYNSIVQDEEGTSFSHGQSVVDSNFRKSSSQTIRYYGGNFKPVNKDGLKKWQSTVAKNPWLFSGEVACISHLVSDKRKQIFVQQAVDAYLNKAYLREVGRLFSGPGPVLFTKGQVLSLLQETRYELTKYAPSQRAVDLLSQFLEAPS